MLRREIVKAGRNTGQNRQAAFARRGRAHRAGIFVLERDRGAGNPRAGLIVHGHIERGQLLRLDLDDCEGQYNYQARDRTQIASDHRSPLTTLLTVSIAWEYSDSFTPNEVVRQCICELQTENQRRAGRKSPWD